MSFIKIIIEEINNSLQNGIPPIKKENMQGRYPEWYNGFKEWLILD